MFHNGDSIPFLEELKRIGKATALDNMPELNEVQVELWEMYCFLGDDILHSVDVYANRIGIPHNWEFRDCVVLMSKMKTKRIKLDKQKREVNG